MRRQILLALLCAAVSPRLALNASGDQPQAAGLRPLNAREGRAIVQQTAGADNEEGRTTDCSHLVHDLYEQAGYPYPYASSLDLYNGSRPFVHVRVPQAGDLIVWRGHVGIVVNPKEHSFFSSVSAGARKEYYDSAYWRARGHARFYRYLTSSPARGSGRTTEAANGPLVQQPKTQAASSGAENRQTLQPVKTTPAVADKPRSEVAPAGAIRADNSPPIPLRTAGRTPKAEEVATALAAANLDAGEILRAADLKQLERLVVVYGELRVSGVEVKGKRGTAQVQIETLAALSAERMESRRSLEDHQLELQHIKKGWVIVPVNHNLYVPRDAALRVLAARLASLTEDADRGTEKEREQADIIRFMNLLIE